MYTTFKKCITNYRSCAIPQAIQDVVKKYNFELGSYKIACPEEQLRKPRVVKVGLFQHKIPLPTWTPIKEMREAMFAMASKALEVASKAGVNVFCFQEAWSKWIVKN